MAYSTVLSQYYYYAAQLSCDSTKKFEETSKVM